MNWVIKEKMNMPMPVFMFLCLASHEALSFIFLVELFCDYANMNLVKLWSWPKSNVCLVNEPNKNTVIILSPYTLLTHQNASKMRGNLT